MAKKRSSDMDGSVENFEKYVYPIEQFEIDDDLLESAVQLVSYYREYPSECVKEYFGLMLYDFQEVLLNEMMWNSHVINMECRNLGKTTLTALFMCTKCVLYPKTQIIICCSNRKQSAESIVKIKQFLAESSVLRSEISELSDSINNPHVVFHNGSTIKVATMSQGARSARATVVVLDEFAWGLEQEIVDSVIVNFLGDYRRTGYLTLDKYLKDPQYEYLKEKPCEIYLSSAGHKASWQYTRFMDYTNKFISGDSGGFFTCNITYMTAIACGLRTKSFYAENMLKEGFNKQKGDAEYLGIWMQDSDNAFFTFESLDNCRTLQKAIYISDLNEFIMSKNKKYLNPHKPSGCIRILGADLAFIKRKDKNDASAYGILQLVPNTRTVTITEQNGEKKKVKIQYYERQLIYLETQQGMLIEKQAERLKMLYFDFDCDYSIIDTKNAGVAIIQELAKPTVDSKTGQDYPPFKCYNDETYAELCNYDSAINTLYCMNASADSNKVMADGLQKVIGNKALQLLIDSATAKDKLSIINGYDDFPQTTQAKLEAPYFETRLLIEEMSALEIKSQNPFILKEPSGGRKDRYSCLLYLNGLADILEGNLNKTKKKKSGAMICKYVPQEFFTPSSSRFI